MLKVKYAFDGESPNQDLDALIREQMEEAGFDECGTDFEDVGGHLRVLEFESTLVTEVAWEMNKAEKAFIGSADQETLQDIVGPAIPLTFEFEPWDDDEEAPPPPPPSTPKKMMFFGWCNKGSSDKIWGVISAQGEWITFWGARTKKLQFKKGDDYSGGTTLDTLIRSKEKKGYNSTTMVDMNTIDPGFETRFEEELLLCMLANNYHTNPYEHA